MNKLGFYIENTLVPGLREAIRDVKPPTILIHAKDRGLLREIRESLSPNSYVVGRMFVEQQAPVDLFGRQPEVVGEDLLGEGAAGSGRIGAV